MAFSAWEKLILPVKCIDVHLSSTIFLYFFIPRYKYPTMYLFSIFKKRLETIKKNSDTVYMYNYTKIKIWFNILACVMAWHQAYLRFESCLLRNSADNEASNIKVFHKRLNDVCLMCQQKEEYLKITNSFFS